MTNVPAPPLSSEPADAQIDAAVLRLVDLLARQAARELVEETPTIQETYDAFDAQEN